MKNLIFYVLLGLSLMFIAACFEGKFTVEKYDPKKPANGFVYALPKTLLKIDIPYTIIHKAGFNEEGNFESKRTAELGEIKVTPIQVPDLEHRYEIKADILDSPVWQNKFSINLTEENYLSKSGITFQDGTLSFIKGLADFVSVATKILAKEPKEDLKKFANEFDRLKAASLENRTRVLELLEKALRRNLSNDELQIIKGRIDILLENEKRIADRMSELKTHIVKRSNIIITHVVEPRKENGNKDYASKVKIDESNCEALKQVIDSFDGDVPKGFIREYWIGILGAGSQNNSEIEPPKNTFIYRIPFSGNFEVRETSEFGKLLAEGMLQVNQLGNLGQIRIQPKKFAKKIYDIEFHAKTGGLLKYDVSTEGFAAESLLTTAQGIVSKIQEETKEKTALEKMQEENQLLQARIDKIKKEKELEELQEGDE